MKDDEVVYAIALDSPTDDLPSYWISKAGGDGPGWTLSPSKRGRLKIPKHDAERLMDMLPMVARMKEEQGWEPVLVKLGKKRGRKKKDEKRKKNAPTGANAASHVPAPVGACNSPRDLLEQVENLRVQAERLCVEAEVDSPEGYWLSDTHSILARLSRKGSQLLLGANSPA